MNCLLKALAMSLGLMCDVLNRSRSEIFQVKDVEFAMAKCLTISTALDSLLLDQLYH